MIYLKLFLTFFKIGLFSFGGGYGMLPMMEQDAISNGWLTEAEFLNFVAISESTPGPVAINMATFIGTSQQGILGALVCTLGVIMPSVIVILLIVAVFKNFLKSRAVASVLNGIKPVIVGLILTTGLFLGLKNFLPNVLLWTFSGISWKSLFLMLGLGAAAFAYKKIAKKNLSAIILIIASAVLGILIF